MSPDKLIVTIVGIAGGIFTYWFFLGKNEEAVSVSGSVSITVEGGYTPSTIVLKKGKPVEITFLRKDNSSCLEEVVLSDFKIRQFLPLNKKVTVTITPAKTGEFPFSCGMGMYHGKIVVK